MEKLREMKRLIAYWSNKNVDFTHDVEKKFIPISNYLIMIFLMYYESQINSLSNELNEAKSGYKNGVITLFQQSLGIELINWFHIALYVGFEAASRGLDNISEMCDLKKDVFEVNLEYSKTLLDGLIMYFVSDLRDRVAVYDQNYILFDKFLSTDDGKEFIQKLKLEFYGIYGLGLIGARNNLCLKEKKT